MEYYQVRKANDINYKDILKDYRQWFSGRIAIVQTNYKPLASFKVYFSDTDLPHLLGWEKVVHKKAYATRLLQLVDQGLLTYQSSRKDQNFNRIKTRLLNYNFLHDIFWDRSQNVCIMAMNMKPNRLRLDVVFYKHTKPREIVVLGLRRNKNMDHFIPTTLHTESAKNNAYLLQRKTSIKSIEWLPKIGGE